MAGFQDHFSALAERYAAYRPHYPPALAELLADRCGHRDIAWDVGCGNGQLSAALATQFTRVIATDPSRSQLDNATPDPRVDYRCVPAEASDLPDASVDLAVAAQAAHWFDWPRFVAEVGRVVRQGGLIALVTYQNAELAAAPGEILAQFYRDVAPYWPNGRVHVNNHYRDLTFPWPDDVVPAPALEMTARWTRDELFGYVTTWSVTAQLVAARGEAPLDDLRRQITAAWPDDEPRDVRWPLTIKLTRR